MIVPTLLVSSLLAAPEGDAVAARRDTRLTPIARIAPAPVPREIPLVPASSRREIDTPDRYVDRAALRSLLLHRRFDELTRYVEQLQAGFEKDPRCEGWPIDATHALGTGEPELTPLLDAWVAAAPKSFAPLLARGSHWESAGWARRGGAVANETAQDDFEAMRDAFARAREDLGRAIALRPRLVAAYVLLYSAAMGSSDPAGMESAYRAAVAACPTCMAPRQSAIHSLEPRWGGSLDAMTAFAASLPTRDAPRLAFLRGYPDLERVTLLEEARRYGEVAAAADRMVAAGEHAPFYWRRGRSKLRRSPDEALVDLQRARELAPGETEILVSVARAHQLARRWEASAIALRELLRVDPLHVKARRWFPDIVAGLGTEAQRLASAGRETDALRLLDLAIDLSPDAEDLLARRDAILLSPHGEPADQVPAFAQKRDQPPGDLETMRRLDRALFKRGEVARAVALWTDFLRTHPNEGRAYLERGGANAQLRQLRQARLDAEQACELGLSEGCARARSLAGR